MPEMSILLNRGGYYGTPSGWLQKTESGVVSLSVSLFCGVVHIPPFMVVCDPPFMEVCRSPRVGGHSLSRRSFI